MDVSRSGRGRYHGDSVGSGDRTHPLPVNQHSPKPMPRSLATQLNTALPSRRLDLLQRLAALATEHGLSQYIVGGFVRDLWLGRPSLDFDIVVEGDATVFATQVLAKLGGQIVTHSKFHTATWNPPD